jgi:hypothetical protein
MDGPYRPNDWHCPICLEPVVTGALPDDPEAGFACGNCGETGIVDDLIPFGVANDSPCNVPEDE